MAHVLWNAWLTSDVKRDLVKEGWTLEKLEERLKTLDPVAYGDPSRKRGLSLIASEADEIFPPATMKHLAAAFGNVPITWIAGDHVRAARALAQELDMVEETFAPLKR